MQLRFLPAAVSASLPAVEGVTMEATVTLECSSAHEMMVMENVPVNLAETVLPLGSFAEIPVLERHASPTLAHLLHANSCVSRRNLLPVVHVAWLGWHGGTVRNSEH